MTQGNPFNIEAVQGKARVGRFSTAHGQFETPAFMPVGTQASVKGMSPRNLIEIGAQIVLSNTYHLHIRPGDELVKKLGGLHKFMSWQGPILTDSGGYQVFSLSKLRKISEDGVIFQSHVDGAEIKFTPERVVEIQQNLGVDIMMVLDECLPYPATEDEAVNSLAITNAWAKRSRVAKSSTGNFIFGIVQGGMYPRLRKQAVEELVEIGFDGYSIGGLSVGEPSELMYQMTEVTAEYLPKEKVRYLMGVGTPSDIVRAVGLGVDMFDCVMPTRSARFGRLFTNDGYINIRNSEFRQDSGPIDQSCDCYTCRQFSRAYLSHLVHVKEVLAIELASVHNLRFYLRLMDQIRQAIRQGSFEAFSKEFLARRKMDEGVDQENS